MTLNKKMTLSAIAILLMATTAVTSYAPNQSNSDAKYTIQLIKDCQVVSEHAMSDKQIIAYKALQSAEQEMKRLENPIAAIEDQIVEYTDKIEELSALAVQENDDRVFIDKRYLAEQQVVVKQLNRFIAEHNQSFTTLSEQGNKISKIAKIFIKAIRVNTPEVSYQQMHISSPDNQQQQYGCQSQISGI